MSGISELRERLAKSRIESIEDRCGSNVPMDAWGAICYVCGDPIPGGTRLYGFTWGSDGVFPDGASAMYCCPRCVDHWIDMPPALLAAPDHP